MTTRADLVELANLAAEQNRREGRKDPVIFANSCSINPDPWQADVLRSRSRRILLNCSRQSGKSTVSSLLACHKAIYYPGSTTLLISPSLRQSGELLRKVQDRLDHWPFTGKLEGESKTVVELPNGSRIISLPATESTIRTFTADLIIEDESGDVPDDLFVAILPMLIVSKGQLILAGTPKGRRGHFFENWERGGPGWERYEIPWTMCPRIDPTDIEEHRISLRDKFQQEYECKFVQSGGGMVYGAYDEINNLIDALPSNTLGQKWLYVLGLDFGFNDACAFVILAYRDQDPTAYIVTSFKEVGIIPSKCAEKVLELDATFHFNKIIGDTGGMGKAYSEEMRRRFHIPVEPADKQNKRGYIDLFNGDMATGAIKFLRHSNTDYIKEMTSLPWADGRQKEHQGFENHLCDAGLYIWRSATMYLNKLPVENKTTPDEKIKQEVEDFWKREETRIKHQRDEIEGGGGMYD